MQKAIIQLVNVEPGNHSKVFHADNATIAGNWLVTVGRFTYDLDEVTKRYTWPSDSVRSICWLNDATTKD